MTRVRWLLVGVIGAELVVGGYLLARHLGRPAPPVPDLSAVDPVLAGEIRALAARCRAAGDWARLGEVYLATGFFPEAEACYREAVRLDPGSADLTFKHAFALERLGRLEEANARYEAAAGLNHPRRDDCWYYVGKNYLRMGREGPAAGAFERAGSLPGARFERTLLAARAGRGGEADAEARRLSEEFPDAYPPVSLRYRLALARNDRPAAARLADEFARRPRPLPTPLAAEITWVFGVANGVGRDRLFRDAGREARAGRLEAAEANLRAALAAGWSPEIADKLADILFALGRPGEADEVLAEAVSRGRPSFELLWRWGQAQDALGRPDRARELWERAARVATGPGAKGLWQDLAARYERAGDPGRARTFRARAHLAGGMESLGAGRPGEAAEALRRAVESDPSLAGAWYLLGEAARAAGRPGDARAAYEECLRLDPDNGRAVRALNLLAARGG